MSCENVGNAPRWLPAQFNRVCARSSRNRSLEELKREDIKVVPTEERSRLFHKFRRSHWQIPIRRPISTMLRHRRLVPRHAGRQPVHPCCCQTVCTSVVNHFGTSMKPVATSTSLVMTSCRPSTTMSRSFRGEIFPQMRSGSHTLNLNSTTSPSAIT